MITIHSGKLIIPEDDRFVGFAGDNLITAKTILSDVEYSADSEYVLYLKFDDDRVTSAVLSASEVETGTELTWNISRENLLKSGIVMAQVKITDAGGTVQHTGSDYFVVGASAELGDDGSELDMLSRSEFEQRMSQAVSEARATAPYIGDDGYWYVYRASSGDYVRSWNTSITVDSQMSSNSLNPVANSAIKSYVDSAANAKVDKTRTVAGLALSSNISAADLADNLQGRINPPLVVPGTTMGNSGQYGRTVDGKPVMCTIGSEWVELQRAQRTYPTVPTVEIQGQYVPDTSSSAFTSLSLGQMFISEISDADVTYVKTAAASCARPIYVNGVQNMIDDAGKMDYVLTINSDSDVVFVPEGQVFCYQGAYYVKTSSGTTVGSQTRLALFEDICSVIFMNYTLSASSWSNKTQQLNISSSYTATSNTKCDIQIDSTVYDQLIADECGGLYVENTSGMLTVHALGNAPTANITVQLTLSEVTAS